MGEDRPKGQGEHVVQLNMPAAGNLFYQAEAYLEAGTVLWTTPPGEVHYPGEVTLTMVGFPARLGPPRRNIRTLVPMYFCLLHAAELFLKSFLSAAGFDKSLDGWSNHNVSKLIKTAVSAELPITPESIEILNELWAANDRFALRFQETVSPMHLPPVADVSKAVHEIRKAVLSAAQPSFQIRTVELFPEDYS